MGRACVASLVGGVALTLTACGAGSGGDGESQSSSSVANTIPTSWTTAAWFIDPANSTGKASDSNACTTAAKPCLTYAEVATLWGTYSPRLRQNTTITFMSSQPGNADPVYFNPYIENGVQVTLQGSLGTAQEVATGTLSNVVTKSRATGQLTEVTLPAGAAPGQLVVNTTKASRAWVYKSAGGSNWFLSQPLAAWSLSGAAFPAETDTWANNDSVVLYQPVSVDLAQVQPTVPDAAVNSWNVDLNVYQLTIFDPLTAPNAQHLDPLYINSNINISESSVQKAISLGAGAKALDSGFINDDFSQSVISSTSGPTMTFWGGQTRYPGAGAFLSLDRADLDGDFIITSVADIYEGEYGAIFIDYGGIVALWDGFEVGQGSFPLNITAIWGGGTLAVLGSSTLGYPPTATATATFLLTGGLYLNQNLLDLTNGTVTGPSTACSVDTSASGSWKCGIALTAANLDLSVSAGGFGGNAVFPGGGTITNTGSAL